MEEYPKDERNLWAELQATESISRRKMIENAATIAYGILILAGVLVSLALYTRPDNLILKIWGIVAAFCLGAASIIWALAMKYGADGKQRNLARLFWAVDMLFLAMNIGAEFAFQLIPIEAPKLFYGALYYWYYVGPALTVVLTAIGLSLLLNFSPDQQMHDKAMKAMKRAADALGHALEHPTEEAQRAFNKEVERAAADLAAHSGAAIRAYTQTVTGGPPATVNGHKKTEAPKA